MEAPKQDTMTPWWKGTTWDMPKDAVPWFANGIPWDTFQDGKPTMDYNPPQWAPGYLPHWVSQCGFWSYRSPICVFPINCMWCSGCCCIENSEFVDIDEPDEWLKKMIISGYNDKTPEWMTGVWWSCDNNAPSESLFSFGDMEWSENGMVGKKNYWQNFGVAANCFGCITLWGAAAFNTVLRMEFSPNNKWISIYTYGSNTGSWIYRDQPEDIYTCKGAAVDLYGESFKPAVDEYEMTRVSHKDETQPLSEPNYQYRFRKLAYLDGYGKLVKTEAWNDYVKRAKMPFAPGTGPNCCGYGFCCRSREQLALGKYPQLNTKLLVRYAPPKKASGAVKTPGAVQAQALGAPDVTV